MSIAPGFEKHDHSACISDAIGAAEALCAAQRLQFTPVRRRALEILLQRHKAMGAYEVLAELTDSGFGAQPPVAYRALDFLVRHGLVHKIEALNAYIACTHPGADHVPAFLICRECNRVQEAEAQPMQGALGRAARAAGFAIDRAVVEAQGLCPDCQQSAGG